VNYGTRSAIAAGEAVLIVGAFVLSSMNTGFDASTAQSFMLVMLGFGALFSAAMEYMAIAKWSYVPRYGLVEARLWAPVALAVFVGVLQQGANRTLGLAVASAFAVGFCAVVVVFGAVRGFASVPAPPQA
jgi:hypothetical protein